VIRAEGVRVVAGGRVLLDDVSFEAPTGSVTGIVGPNGGGKTTLLRALVRAVPLAGGRVTVDGEDVRTRSRRWIARRIAEVGQRQDPDESLTVADEVALGGLAEHGVLRAGRPSRDARIAAALDAVGLAHLAADRLATLSGGELQRVALARALAQGAGHVLLDEPTNHLDIRHRLEVVGLMRRIAPTVVVVLHDLEAAAAACDHVVVIDRGRVAGAGSPRDVLRPELLDAVYGVRTTLIPDADGHPHLRFTLPAPGDPLGASTPLERTRP